MKDGALNILSLSRRAAADAALLNYNFGDLVVADQGGWESTQPGLEFMRTLFFENPDGGNTIKGHFTVIFESETSIEIRESYGMLDGILVGGPEVDGPSNS